MTEFVLADHVGLARNKLRALVQTSTVPKYLSEFRNICLTIADMNEGERLNKFVSGLKYELHVEVLKKAAGSFEEAAKTTLRTDSAIWGAPHEISRSSPNTSPITDPTAMEIGNVEGRQRRRPMDKQRLADLRNNACFKWHKPGCRLRKHRKNPRNVPANNMNVLRNEQEKKDEYEEFHFLIDSDSEN